MILHLFPIFHSFPYFLPYSLSDYLFIYMILYLFPVIDYSIDYSANSKNMILMLIKFPNDYVNS